MPSACGNSGITFGREIFKVVPRPGLAVHLIEPSWRRMIPELTARPIPVPALPLVVKNGSKSRCLTSGVMPVPVSVIWMTTRSRFPGRHAHFAAGRHSVDGVIDYVHQDLAEFDRVAFDVGLALAVQGEANRCKF